jgi:hypothetical protein
VLVVLVVPAAEQKDPVEAMVVRVVILRVIVKVERVAAELVDIPVTAELDNTEVRI